MCYFMQSFQDLNIRSLLYNLKLCLEDCESRIR